MAAHNLARDSSSEMPDVMISILTLKLSMSSTSNNLLNFLISNQIDIGFQQLEAGFQFQWCQA
jgi:hypothetical protein